MGIISLFSISPLELITGLAALATAMTLHQLAHAIVARRAGDPMPRYERALSTNPMRHLHWFGSLAFLFLDFGVWKRAPITPFNLQEAAVGGVVAVPAAPDRAPRTAADDPPENADDVLASFRYERWNQVEQAQDFYAALLAGPLANLVLAIAVGFYLRGQVLDPGLAASLLNQMVLFNLLMFVMSFVPLHPMDGWLALLSVLPRETARRLARYEREACYALAALIVLHFLTASGLAGLPAQFDILDRLVGSPARILFFRFAR